MSSESSLLFSLSLASKSWSDRSTVGSPQEEKREFFVPWVARSQMDDKTGSLFADSAKRLAKFHSTRPRRPQAVDFPGLYRSEFNEPAFA